jgi:hypothetical protein
MLMKYLVMPAFSILIGELNDVFSPASFAQDDYSLEDAITPIALYFLCIFFMQFREIVFFLALFTL